MTVWKVDGRRGFVLSLPLTAALVFVAAAGPASTPAIQTSERRTVVVQDDYDLRVNSLRAAAQNRNLDAMQQATLEADAQWAQTQPSNYVRFLRIAVDEARSRDFADRQRSTALVRGWAATAVEKATDGERDVQIHMLNCCLRLAAPSGKSDAAWTQERRKSAALWVHVWQNIEGSIDPDWRLNDPKLEIKPYVAPPGVPFRSGMNPDDIRDAQVREEYKAHLEKNRRLTEYNKQQQSARKLIQEHQKDVENYLVFLYTVAPADTPELQALLAPVKNNEMKTRILAVVQRRTSPN